MITYQEVKNNDAIRTYLIQADETLSVLGYTEHSIGHASHVAMAAGDILRMLNYEERLVELGRISGYLHDIGNLVNREDHAQSGAIIVWTLLQQLGMPAEDIATVVSAVGNHDEKTGVPVNAVTAALILADKADVRRSRVRNTDISRFDIHDRVNYSVIASVMSINEEKTIVTLSLTVDTQFSSVMDFFEIFMERMLFSKKAALKLGLQFRLVINDQTVL